MFPQPKERGGARESIMCDNNFSTSLVLKSIKSSAQKWLNPASCLCLLAQTDGGLKVKTWARLHAIPSPAVCVFESVIAGS